MSTRRINVSPNDCIPMKEMERDFYNSTNYLYIKRRINDKGFNDAYAPRAIPNEELRKYEVFDGIHRLKAAQDLELKTIPLIVEDISREDAIIEGYTANRSHAWYNAIDKA